MWLPVLSEEVDDDVNECGRRRTSCVTLTLASAAAAAAAEPRQRRQLQLPVHTVNSWRDYF